MKEQKFRFYDSASTARQSEYRTISTAGWIIVFYKNEPVNYYADYALVDSKWFYVDEIFRNLCRKLPLIDIEEIIEMCLEISRKVDILGNKFD
jgi:hypothetical protein